MAKAIQRKIELHDESIEKIKNHKSTRTIAYPDYKEAYDYVDSKYPLGNVKEATILQCSRSFLDKIGYKSIGGFYSILRKVIVIPDDVNNSSKKTKDIWASVKAEMSVDEILVHEMLHYISHKVNPAKRTMQVEEEFAYGNSADYLRSKGHDDDFIIKKNFMPYLIMVSISSLNVDVGSLNEEENKKVFDLTFKNAYNLGKSILEIWDNKKHGKSSSEASIEKKVISIDFD